MLLLLLLLLLQGAGGGVWVKDGRGRHTNIAALLALTRPSGQVLWRGCYSVLHAWGVL